MKCWSYVISRIALCLLIISGVMQAQIRVTSARIGCLPIQKEPNLTEKVAEACKDKNYCSYKAPNPQQAGIPAATRWGCTQAMEIKYQCGRDIFTKTAFVPGDAWGHPPAELDCRTHEAAVVAGPLSVTAPIDPPNEPCSVQLNPQSPRGLLTTEYHWAPSEFLDNPSGPEQSDGRLSPVLRAHARVGDAHTILVNAVKAYLSMPSSIQGIPVPGDPKLAPALAQLAVTGRRAFASFAQWHPQDNDLVLYVKQANPHQNFDSQGLQKAAARTLDVAYTALWAIRANDANWRQLRQQLGWIAVSGEDDLPLRPVNIPTAPYPQYDAQVGVIAGRPIFTRYMVASAGASLKLLPGVHGATPVAPRSIPSDERPNIPAQNKIIIYIHGGGSRLEEAVPLADQLIKTGAARGVSYTVISFDMPNSGLSTPFDHTLVANAGPGGALGSYHPPQGDPSKLPPDPPLTYGYPILDTEEQLVLNFIDVLDQQIGNVKPRISAVMGGSLGGNISFRLARRANQYPFLRNIVSWSVTCMMPYIGGFANVQSWVAGHLGGLIADYEEEEQPATSRHVFFDKLYNHSLGPGLPAQPQMWYRDGWEPCRSAHILGSKFDRYEYYTREHRRWTYRLNYEMTIFTFQEGDLYAPNHAQGPPRYSTVNAHMLLAAGDRDEHDPLYTLYSSTVGVAGKMANTSGQTLFLKDTGHSIHDERPAFFAQQITEFLNGHLAPPPLSGMKISTQLGTEGTGARQMSWIKVNAADEKTGKPVNGSVSIGTYSESETTSTDSSGKVHRSRQQISTAKGVCAPPNVACNSGPTGTKVYYRCGTRGDCVLSVNAPGYAGGEITLR